MKAFIALILLITGVSAFGQGQSIRAQDGQGTNATLRLGLTLRPGDPSQLRGITNIGAYYLYLGSTVAGTHMVIMDTNGVPRIQLGDASFLVVDGSGNIQLRVNATGIEGVTGMFVGNGAGLTNLSGATNFNSSVTYNFNGKTTFNSVSYNTNKWNGPTNTLILTTNFQEFVASGDCNITNVGGQIAGQYTWTTLTISNSTAGDITVRSTASGLRAQGSGTTAALIIGAGKEGILSYQSRDLKSTNYVTTAQSN